MGLSARSLQRYRELGRTLRRHPELGPELPLSKVESIARVASDDTVEQWVAVGERIGVTELNAAVAQIEAGVDSRAVLRAYVAAAGETTDTVGLQAVFVPVPPRLTDRVHPDLPEAARWLLVAVVLPAQRGTGKAKERVHFVCANPECRRLALRNHAHHLRMRSLGGPDTPENLVCACPSCHLRLIHPGHVAVDRVGNVLVWRFPGWTVRVFERYSVTRPSQTSRAA